MLTPEEFSKLQKNLGNQATVFIERLNGYIGQIGQAKASKKYVSHYHTILNWYGKDKADGTLTPGRPVVAPRPFVEDRPKDEDLVSTEDFKSLLSGIGKGIPK